MQNWLRAGRGAARGLGFIMAVLVLGGCPSPVDEPPADITWTARADGEAGAATSTAITFDFSRDPGELGAGDIILTAGTGAADKGTLSGSGTSRSLALNSVSTEGAVKLAIKRAGIAGGEKTVTLFKAPASPGKGTLIYTVTVPDGVAAAPGSRIWIEQGEDGEVFAELNSNGFTAGVRPLTGSVTGASLELDPGLYVVDILLVGENGKSAAFRDTVEIQEGEEAELVFDPPADDFLTGGGEGPTEPTALITIRAATGDSSGLKISAGGSGSARTRTLAVPNGVQTLYLAALKKSSQTLTISGDDALKVTAATAGAGVPDGIETPGSAKDILIVDSSGIAETGGSMNFVITVQESGKLSITYAVTLNIPSLTALYVYFQKTTQGSSETSKLTYQVGEEFDPASVELHGEYSDGTKNIVITDYEVEGFDSSTAGILAVRFKKSGMYATDGGRTSSFAITILAPSEARLIFPYGGRIDDGVPQRGRYTVTEGHTLVIAPVLWRVPAGATFQWTVSGTSSYTTNGEFLTFKPGVSTGNYNVTVTASFGGQIVSASTTVECVNASSPPSPDLTRVNGGVAPGQFVEPTNWGDSLGGYGGSMTYDLSMDNGPGDDFHISGNAFGYWIEPGIIWVMKDENHNGKADDTWYELKCNAEELGIPITRRYAVTYYQSGAWEDNLGGYGTCGPAQKYPSSTYPGSSSVTLAGTLIELTDSGDVNVSLQGCVDTADELYDISDAIQVDGTPVTLDHIDFIRVQTAEHRYSGTFGEKSTEIKGGSQGIGGVWVESRTLTGTSNGSGYTYSFVNNSGYDLTVSFRDITATLSVPAGKTVPYTSAESKLYYNYSGGNVNSARSGSVLTFTNG